MSGAVQCPCQVLHSMSHTLTTMLQHVHPHARHAVAFVCHLSEGIAFGILGICITICIGSIQLFERGNVASGMWKHSSLRCHGFDGARHRTWGLWSSHGCLYEHDHLAWFLPHNFAATVEGPPPDVSLLLVDAHHQVETVVCRFGWPFRSAYMRASGHLADGFKGPVAMTPSQAVPVRINAFTLWIPVGIIWPAVVLDIACFASVWIAGRVMIRQLILRRRAGHGLCCRCRYPVDSAIDACPECGTLRTPFKKKRSA